MSCDTYIQFLFYVGAGTIILGLLLGAALAITTVILLLCKSPTPTAGVTAAAVAPATPTAVLEAMKAFLQALSAAPTWLALFGAGVLLLWLAGSGAPERCACPPNQPNCTRVL